MIIIYNFVLVATSINSGTYVLMHPVGIGMDVKKSAKENKNKYKQAKEEQEELLL